MLVNYPSPYPFPEPSIRRVWKCRGCTSLSPKYIDYPARASKNAVPTSVSCFFLGSLVKKPYKTLSEEPPEKIKQISILRFFLFFSSLALPAAAGDRYHQRNNDISKRSSVLAEFFPRNKKQSKDPSRFSPISAEAFGTSKLLLYPHP